MQRTTRTSVLLGWCMVLAACGPVRARPGTPVPNVLARHQLAGSAEVRVVGATDDKTCQKARREGRFCVWGLESSVRSGLSEVIDLFFTGTGERHTATLTILELFREYVSAGYSTTFNYTSGEMRGVESQVTMTARVTIRWQFRLVGPNGEPVAQFTGTTPSRRAMVGGTDADAATRSVIESVLEEVGAALNDKLSEPDAPAREESE